MLVYQRVSIHYALILDLNRFRLLGLSISRPATSIFARACDGCFGRWLSHPSEKYSSNGMIIANIWTNKIHLPNHQPVINGI